MGSQSLSRRTGGLRARTNDMHNVPTRHAVDDSVDEIERGARLQMIDQVQNPATSEGQTLTKRQREILEFIQEYLDTNGYPPTVRDIGGAVGLTSSSTVHAHQSHPSRAPPAATRPKTISRIFLELKTTSLNLFGYKGSKICPHAVPAGALTASANILFLCNHLRPRRGPTRKT